MPCCSTNATRLPKDPETNKPEPLLMFKRGALVHFAVSQYEVYMATQLAGEIPSSCHSIKARMTGWRRQ